MHFVYEYNIFYLIDVVLMFAGGIWFILGSIPNDAGTMVLCSFAFLPKESGGFCVIVAECGRNAVGCSTVEYDTI